MSRPGPLLTESAVGKTLLVFSLPILGANVLQSLNGSVNSIWVGRFLGSVALTATSNANTVMFFLISMVFGVGRAGSTLVGQAMGAMGAMGAGDLDRAKRVVGAAKSWLPPGRPRRARDGHDLRRPLPGGELRLRLRRGRDLLPRPSPLPRRRVLLLDGRDR